jgi:CelD/BcsL family acetyltransferase involved in cellulose biosynthesis
MSGAMFPAGKIVAPKDRAGLPLARLEAVALADDVRILARSAAGAVAGLAGEWTALAARAAEPNAFAEHWFVAASLAALAGRRDIGLLEARRGHRLIGLLPVALEKTYARLPVAFAQNWCHHQMFLGTPLVEAGEEEAFWAGVLATLDELDWTPNFLHVRGLVEDGPVHRGLKRAAEGLGRSCAIVHRETRALLESDLSPEAYYEQAVRQKKRKELRRLRNRLAELGPLAADILGPEDPLEPWCDAYLALEKDGWKGAAGSALACDPATETFFRETLRAAREAGRLQFRRLRVGDKVIAMLVNFLTPPGSFSFKTVFDEDYARFSPGVLIQIDNLDLLDRADIAWMDSCAVEDHPMIDSLWTERRSIVRTTVRLKGLRRGAIFAACRALEMGSAAARSWLDRRR